MSLFKKDWTPQEADEWTVHDLAASTLGALSFFLVTIGLAGALLLRTWGFVALVGAVVSAVLMFKVIDPKLKALSAAFDERQDGYLEELERKVRWETDDGD